jgi:hypothetical protein
MLKVALSRIEKGEFGNWGEQANSSKILIFVEQAGFARYLEDFTLVLDHIVAPHRSLLGTAILSDRTA